MEHPDFKRYNDKDSLVWQAEDFYYHPKSFLWYLSALLITILIAGFAWLLSGRNDLLSPIAITLALLSFTVYAGRKPATKNFELNSTRLLINSQPFYLDNFSRYWVEEFDTHTQISIIGIKRTAMPIGLCLKDKDLTKKVLSILQTALPETNPSQNPADWLTRKIKF